MNEPYSSYPIHPLAPVPPEAPIPPAPMPVRPKRSYTPWDGVVSLLLLFLCTLFAYTVRAGGGFGVTLFFFGIILIFAVSLCKSGKKLTAAHGVFLAVLALLSVTFSLYSLTVLSVCATLFLGGFGSLWAYTAFTGRPLFNRFWVWDMGRSLIAPFSAFGSLFGAFRELRKGKKRTLLNVLIGLAIALPLTAFVAALLQSADAAFAGVFSDLFSSFPKHILCFFMDAVLGLPLALYLHAMLVSGREQIPKPDLDERRRLALVKSRIAPISTLFAASTPMLVLYTLFLAVLSGYFFSAFSGLIPNGMTYSDCARRGFFELCTIAAFNLVLIWVMWRLCRYEGRPPRILRLYNILFSLITMLLIAVAVSKMLLYMQFGLTVLRVYTTWFMSLLAVIFILIVLRMLLQKLPLLKATGIAVVALCLILFGSPVNSLIAAYNVTAYQHGEIDMDMAYLEILDEAAVPWIGKLTDDSDKAVAQDARRYVKEYADIQANNRQHSLPYLLSWTLERELAVSSLT